MNILPIKLPILLSYIREAKHFAFSRYGDGEWNAIFGVKGKNTDKHQYFPKMGKELRQSLYGQSVFGENYLMGMQSLGYSFHKKTIDTLLASDEKLRNISWVESDFFHNLSIRGELYPIIRLLNLRGDAIIVGPKYLETMREFLKYTHFIPVSRNDCYLEKDRIKKEILNYKLTKPGIFCFSSSMLTEILIYDLFNLFPTSAFIDFGSVWDVFVGVPTRRYHSDGRMTKEKISRNLYGK